VDGLFARELNSGGSWSSTFCYFDDYQNEEYRRYSLQASSNLFAQSKIQRLRCSFIGVSQSIWDQSLPFMDFTIRDGQLEGFNYILSCGFRRWCRIMASEKFHSNLSGQISSIKYPGFSSPSSPREDDWMLDSALVLLALSFPVVCTIPVILSGWSYYQYINMRNSKSAFGIINFPVQHAACYLSSIIGHKLITSNVLSFFIGRIASIQNTTNCSWCP
jgi:hypothetical protein